MQFGKHVRIRNEKFGAVVFETLHEKVYVANETGAEILGLFEEKKEPADMIAELARNYDCQSATIKEDVEEFILMLKENEIVNEEM